MDVDIKRFIKDYEEIETACEKAFDKFVDADLTKFGKYSKFERIEMDDLTEKEITIRYYDNGYDSYEFDFINLPIDCLLDDKKLDEHINKLVEEKNEKELARKKQAIKVKEENERKEYERLKAKYGD